MKVLYASVPGISGIESIVVGDSHTTAAATAQVVAHTCNLSLGSSATVTLGYTDDHFIALTGYVKNIELREPDYLYNVTIANVMIRAVDYFVAASNPENPFKRQNILAEHLVRDVLHLAGLTSFQSDSSSFTFAISNPVEVNLTSAYDFCRFIGDIIAFNLYADNNGVVQFRNRRPYPTGSDTSVFTITENILLDASYEISDRDLRNRVIVYGTNIQAEASAPSPYLPSGFYKTVVVAAPGVIDSQSMAQQSANYNLDILNRLTKKLNLTIEGTTGLKARECVTVNIPSIGINGQLWYIYAIEHNWSKNGYVTNLELRYF